MLTKTEKTYIFIPGGWHGAWAFDSITERLEKLGKKCFSLTLPGLEIEPTAYNEIINLDTHIKYVVDFVSKENIGNIILCGHSYGGMVIAGVADRIPERIDSLVYIDAYVPEDGDSCWTLTSDRYRQLFATGASTDGFSVAVPQGSETRRRPHPLATFMQSLKLNGDHRQVRNRTFIYLSEWEQTPFKNQYEKLKTSEDWHVETVRCGHNIMRENPEKLIEILTGRRFQ